jgi:hypothetical protein
MPGCSRNCASTSGQRISRVVDPYSGDGLREILQKAEKLKSASSDRELGPHRRSRSCSRQDTTELARRALKPTMVRPRTGQRLDFKRLQLSDKQWFVRHKPRPIKRPTPKTGLRLSPQYAIENQIGYFPIGAHHPLRAFPCDCSIFIWPASPRHHGFGAMDEGAATCFTAVS